MGEVITTTGIVLSAMNVGDFDRRIVLLTKERGKIAAFAKGARRQNSPNIAVCQPFSFGQFQLYEGRTAYNLQSAEITNYFTELRQDLEAIYLGMYFCEMADYLTRENNEEVAILKLLYQTLRALAKNTIPYRLIRAIYEIKVLAYYGQGMQVFVCSRCGAKEPLVAFWSSDGGALCEKCAKTVQNGLKMSHSTLYTLQYILSSPLEKLYTFKVSNEVMKELREITRQYLRFYIDKPLKTAEFLEDNFWQ